MSKGKRRQCEKKKRGKEKKGSGQDKLQPFPSSLESGKRGIRRAQRIGNGGKTEKKKNDTVPIIVHAKTQSDHLCYVGERGKNVGGSWSQDKKKEKKERSKWQRFNSAKSLQMDRILLGRKGGAPEKASIGEWKGKRGRNNGGRRHFDLNFHWLERMGKGKDQSMWDMMDGK